MLCREIIAVYSEIHTKHINTLCGQNVEFNDDAWSNIVVTVVWRLRGNQKCLSDSLLHTAHCDKVLC